MNINLETPNENFVALDVLFPFLFLCFYLFQVGEKEKLPEQEQEKESENKPEEGQIPVSKSKNLEMVPLKTSKDNLSPEVRQNPTQGSTMWKKKAASDSRPVASSTTIMARPRTLWGKIKVLYFCLLLIFSVNLLLGNSMSFFF